jgi:hypothetical protein
MREYGIALVQGTRNPPKRVFVSFYFISFYYVHFTTYILLCTFFLIIIMLSLRGCKEVGNIIPATGLEPSCISICDMPTFVHCIMVLLINGSLPCFDIFSEIRYILSPLDHTVQLINGSLP